MDNARYQAITDYLATGEIDLNYIQAAYDLNATTRITSQEKRKLAVRNFITLAHKHYLRNGHLYRDGYQVVPEAEVDRVLSDVYQHVLGGRNKMFYEVKQRRLAISKRRVTEWLKGSKQYQVNKYQPRKTIKPILSSKPLERLQIDLAYIERDTEEQVTHYVLVVIDHFTKYVWLFPTTSKSVWTMAEHLATVVRSHGVPSIIQSDNGKEFADIARKVERVLGRSIRTQHITSMPYAPQTQGLVERTVQTLKRTLRRIIQRGTSYDPLMVKQVEHSINNSYQDTIGMTPVEALDPMNHELVRQRIAKKAASMVDKLPELPLGAQVRVHRRAFHPELLKLGGHGMDLSQFTDEVYHVQYRRGNEYMLHEVPLRWFRIDDLMEVNKR